MRVIVNGACGHMGQEIVRLTREGYLDSALASAVDPRGDSKEVLSRIDQSKEADVIIDFSHHAATDNLLAYALEKKLSVVIATTGHTDAEKALIDQAAREIPVFFSANMSLGVALLCRLAAETAAAFPDADIEIVETHHNRKLDAPSGTALMLFNAIKAVRDQAVAHVGRSGMQKRERSEIGIHSVRRGGIVGIHEVLVSTATQTITLRHEAHSRALFAEGAMTAARFLMGKPAGLYDMYSIIGQ